MRKRLMLRRNTTSTVRGVRDRARMSFVETAREVVRDGVGAASRKAGELAGAGLVAATAFAAEATGHQPSALVTAGSLYAGAKVGSFVGKVIAKRAGGGGSPVDTVLGQLAAADTATVAAQNEAAATIPALDAALDAFATVHGLDSKNPLAGRAMAQVRSARQAVGAGTRLLKAAQKHIETTSLTIMRGT